MYIVHFQRDVYDVVVSRGDIMKMIVMVMLTIMITMIVIMLMKIILTAATTRKMQNIFTRLGLVARLLGFVSFSKSFQMPQLILCKIVARHMLWHSLEAKHHATHLKT